MSVVSQIFPNPSSFGDGAFRNLPRNGNVSEKKLAEACRAALEAAGLDVSVAAHRGRTAPVRKFGRILLDAGIFVFKRRLRKGGRVYYGDVAVCVGGKMSPLRVASLAVNHRGGIYPRKDQARALAAFNEQRRAGGSPEVEGREGAASLLATEWTKTEREDPEDPASEEYIPEDAERTLAFEVRQYIAEAYAETIRRRKAAGAKVLELCAEKDEEGEVVGLEKNAAVIAALCAEGAFVSSDQLADAALPEEPTRLAIVPAPRVYDAIAVRYSRDSKNTKRRNKPMLSGCARFKLLLGDAGVLMTKKGKPRATYGDKTKPFVNLKGARDYEPLKNSEGDLLSDLNVHEVINAGTAIDMLTEYTLSYSPQGVSMKAEATYGNFTVRDTSQAQQSASDIFGDDYDGGGAAAPVVAPAAAAAPAKSGGGATAEDVGDDDASAGGGGAADDEDLGDLGDIDAADLDELMGDDGQ